MFNQTDQVQVDELKEVWEALIALESDQLQQPVYPAEFLNSVADTALKTLQDCLKKIDAPEAASSLLEDLICLITWSDAVEKGVGVSSVGNQVMIETVANATQNIMQLGGVFCSPAGATTSQSTDA